MSGFEIKPQRYATLKFEGTEWEGLEVRVRLDVPLGILMEVQALSASETEALEMFPIFADNALDSWNAEIGGELLPATAEGIKSLPLEVNLLMVRAWIKAVQELGTPLAKE